MVRNGEKLYFILEDNMKSQLVEYSFTDKTFEKTTPENIYLSWYSSNYYVAGDQLIYQSSTVTTPDEIYLSKNGEINPITSVNKDFIDNKIVGQLSLFHFRALIS